jgi:16S rRNA (guanine(966)-N(2))-methyltransferase RsmD
MIRPPGNLPVRPTTDFAKTGLFNMLENRFRLKNMEALDLFCGTGSISMELISRGCIHVTAVDQDPKCISFLRSFSAKLAVTNLTALRSEVIHFLKKTTLQTDLIFADPPFGTTLHESLHGLIMERKLLKENGVFILEHSSRSDYSALHGFDFSRKYSNVTFSFFNFVQPQE